MEGFSSCQKFKAQEVSSITAITKESPLICSLKGRLNKCLEPFKLMFWSCSVSTICCLNTQQILFKARETPKLMTMSMRLEVLMPTCSVKGWSAKFLIILKDFKRNGNERLCLPIELGCFLSLRFRIYKAISILMKTATLLSSVTEWTRMASQY